METQKNLHTAVALQDDLFQLSEFMCVYITVWDYVRTHVHVVTKLPAPPWQARVHFPVLSSVSSLAGLDDLLQMLR